MNGFADSGLDESAFEDKQGLSALKTFDAFREFFQLFFCFGKTRVVDELQVRAHRIHSRRELHERSQN